MAFETFPKMKPVRVGEDARFDISIQNTGDSSVPNYTGATGSVVFTPEIGSAFTNSVVLSGTPSVAPQMYVLIADTDTSGMATPQTITAICTITVSGSLDKVAWTFDLLP